MKRRMKTKLVIALMFILTLGLALGIGAYWAGVVNAPADVEDTVEVTMIPIHTQQAICLSTTGVSG